MSNVTRIVFVNQSTVMSDADVARVAEACDLQMRDDYCPAYGLVPVPVTMLCKKSDGTTDPLGPGDAQITFVDDDPTVPGAGGFHDERSDGTSYGEVLAGVYYANGEGFDGASVAASHETMELVGDADINRWCDCGDGSEQVEEMSDRVEGDSYDKTLVDGSTVKVSNFLLRAAFNPQAQPGEKRDFLGTLPTDSGATPLDMTAGGYETIRPVGADKQNFAVKVGRGQRHGGKEPTIVHDIQAGVTHVFGPAMPEWKRKVKLLRSRTVRRLAKKRRATAPTEPPPPPPSTTSGA